LVELFDVGDHCLGRLWILSTVGVCFDVLGLHLMRYWICNSISGEVMCSFQRGRVIGIVSSMRNSISHREFLESVYSGRFDCEAVWLWVK